MGFHLNSTQDLFHFLSKIQFEKNITWYCNEHGHGKDRMDAFRKTVQNLVFRDT